MWAESRHQIRLTTNCILSFQVVSVSRTPGHTKHFQTIYLTSNVRLCDCPGLVFPSKVPKTLQVHRYVCILKISACTDSVISSKCWSIMMIIVSINPLNPELNPICYLLALLAHHFLHVSRIRVKSLTLRLLMSYIYIYIYMERLFLMFLDHTQRRSTVGRTPLDE